MRRALVSLRDDQAGSVLVETALVIPVLFLLGFGAFEFGNIFYEYQSVTTGVRDAARYLARAPLGSAATSDCVEAINNLSAAAQNLAVSGDVHTAAPARVPGWAPAHVTVSPIQIQNPIDPDTHSPTYRGPVPFTCVVKVTSTFSYQQLGFLEVFKLPAPQITVSHSERWVGD